MPISTQSMLSQLRPLSAIDIGDFGNAGAERQKLKLMREQFEETKRRHLEDERLRALSEAGEMRRAEMTTERQREQAEAAAAEKRRAEAATAYSDFYKAQDANDIAGMASAAQRLREFGGLADNLGTDEQGRPSYRLGVDAEAYRKREAELDAQAAPRAPLGAPEGSVWLPPGLSPESLDDSLQRLSALGHDRTQEGVVDHGEFLDQRRAQAAPVLESLRMGLPAGPYRQSAERTDEAALLLGRSPSDTAKSALDFRKEAGGVIGGTLDDLRADDQLDLDRERFGLDREKFEFEKSQAGRQKPLTREDEQKLMDFGEKDAKEPYDNRLIKGRLTILEAAAQVKGLLEDDDPNNDEKAVNLLMELNKNVGAQSNADAERMTGEQKASFMRRVSGWVKQWLVGGYDPELSKSMADFADRLANSNRDEIYSYIADMTTAEGKEKDELVRRGIRGYVERNIPSHILQAYDEAQAKEEAEDGGAPAEQQPQGQPVSDTVEGKKTGRWEDDPEFMDTLNAAAHHFRVAADKILPLLRKESAGQGEHAANPKSSARGLLQMLDKVAREFVNPETGENFKDADEFGALSAAQQAPVIAEYFARKGVNAASSAADYALAVAAPALVGKGRSRDTVVYPKPENPETAGNDDPWVANAPWRPADGGDITVGSILDFYLGKSRGKKPEGTGLSPVGSSGAAPTARTRQAREQQRAAEEEPESAEDGIPDTRPRMRHLEKPAKGQRGANDGELDSLLE